MIRIGKPYTVENGDRASSARVSVRQFAELAAAEQSPAGKAFEEVMAECGKAPC